MTPRVLVVDDDESIVDGLTALLLLEEIESAGACDRLSARAMFTGAFYPVIVADVRLNTLAEGLELLEEIRTLSPNSRVLSLTGCATPELEHELRLRGSTATICKPASGAEMIDAITALLADVQAVIEAADSAELHKLHASVEKILYAIARRRYRLDSDQAEDVVQQAWLLFLQKRSAIESAPAWLAGTVKNLCRKQIHGSVRSRETLVEGKAIDNIVDPRKSPELSLALEQALAGLDQVSRDVCRLIAIEGHAYGEVSLLTGVPLGTIGPMYLRAKKKMRKNADSARRPLMTLRGLPDVNGSKPAREAN